ncbi:MAG: glycerol kinase [Verrucomicrobia bacterium]|nr:MAG: glycerol kinase [Verrucomicrobiota bacterium]
MSAPSRKFILALDQGTTSSRSILFDHTGKIHASASREFEQHFPKPGWVEHDPMDIWSTQIATAEEVLNKSGLTSTDLAAIGITNQRETTFVWERATGTPIYPAIVWQDRRTAVLCQRLWREGADPVVTEKTGLRLDPYFSATKVHWILENVEGARSRAEAGELAFGTVDSWLIWQLTEGRLHATDPSNASRTLLFNLARGDWDDELLELFDIPRSMMPEIRDSSGTLGEGSGNALLAGVPIAGVAGDQQAALFGQACFKPGMAKNTYGTGCFLLMQTGEERLTSTNNLLTTVAWRIGGETEYALEGSIFVAGALIQWLRDELGVIESASECDRLAAEVGDSGGVVIVPAFTGLGAPYWDPHARGTIQGITRGTTRAHLCRAALEAIAYQTADLVACMERDSGRSISEMRVDGGVARSDLMLQFQSDLLGISVVRPTSIETTALGAAYLAGLGVGFWENREAITERWSTDAAFSPRVETSRKDLGQMRWKRAVERSLEWAEGDD